MVRNIVIVLILVLVGVPSWQIGTIMIQKKQVTHLLEEQANSIKRYDNEELVKKNLTKELELLKLPSAFTFEMLERRKVKIGYKYKAAASIFGYTYYQVNESLEAVTEEGQFDR
jgi:Tfp pilus assembly protein PilE